MKPRAMLGAVCIGLAPVLSACTSPGGNMPSPSSDEGARDGTVITVGSFDPVVRRDAVALYGTRLLTVLDAVSARPRHYRM